MSELNISIVECNSPWLSKPDTIVFHHGLGACSQCWNGWVSTLADQYRLVFFDMRGHGRTPVRADHVWSLDGMIADLAQVVGAAVPAEDKFHLVGESIGGTVALAYAARFSDRLQSLTVSNGAHQGGSLGNLDNWREIMDKGGMDAWSAHMMKMRFEPGALAEPMHQWYQEQQSKCDQRSILDAVQLLIGADLSDELGRISVPTLLLHPDSSPFIPVAVMADLKGKLANAQLKVFPRTRHGLPFSHARQCAGSMRDFLDTCA